MSQTVNWDSHEFTVYGPQTSWNEVGGIYIFAGATKDWTGNLQWRAFYVGKTQNFATRLPNHEDWLAAVQLGATHIHARTEEQANVRAQLEQNLIQKCQPVLNVQHR